MYCQECKTEEGTPHLPGCSYKMSIEEKAAAEERMARLIDSRTFTQKEVEQGIAAMEKILALTPHNSGDTYDEDTGIYLGQLTDTEHGIKEEGSFLATLPAQISIFYEGYWYIFKPQSRYKEGEQS